MRLRPFQQYHELLVISENVFINMWIRIFDVVENILTATCWIHNVCAWTPCDYVSLSSQPNMLQTCYYCIVATCLILFGSFVRVRAPTLALCQHSRNANLMHAFCPFQLSRTADECKIRNKKHLIKCEKSTATSCTWPDHHKFNVIETYCLLLFADNSIRAVAHRFVADTCGMLILISCCYFVDSRVLMTCLKNNLQTHAL